MTTGATILRTCRARADRGAVTAELAVAFTGLIPLLLAVASLVAVLLAQLEVTGAAASAARLVARGENPAAVREVVLAAAGPQARLDLQAQGGLTRVSVTRRVEVPGIRQWQVTGTAAVPTETHPGGS